MPFEFEPLAIKDVILIKPKRFSDDRGFFMETFKKSDFEKYGINVNFVQDNHSLSSKGVIRGLHFQKDPAAQGKLVRVVSGSVYDVAVDIRADSPTYGKWVSATLSSENGHMLWVPPGFAHGVMVLEENTHLLYKVSGSEYSPDDECCIHWEDPTIGVIWPNVTATLSEKDRDAITFIDLESHLSCEEV